MPEWVYKLDRGVVITAYLDFIKELCSNVSRYRYYKKNLHSSVDNKFLEIAYYFSVKKTDYGISVFFCTGEYFFSVTMCAILISKITNPIVAMVIRRKKIIIQL